MTEPAEEQPDPRTVARPIAVPTDGRAADATQGPWETTLSTQPTPDNTTPCL